MTIISSVISPSHQHLLHRFFFPAPSKRLGLYRVTRLPVILHLLLVAAAAAAAAAYIYGKSKDTPPRIPIRISVSLVVYTYILHTHLYIYPTEELRSREMCASFTFDSSPAAPTLPFRILDVITNETTG